MVRSSAFTAIGDMLFNHFEKLLPLAKAFEILFFISVTVLLSATLGWALSFLGLTLLVVLYVHAVRIPSKASMAGLPKPRASIMS